MDRERSKSAIIKVKLATSWNKLFRSKLSQLLLALIIYQPRGSTTQILKIIYELYLFWSAEVQLVHIQILQFKKPKILWVDWTTDICSYYEPPKINLIHFLPKHPTRLYDWGSTSTNPLLAGDQPSQANWYIR